jgi:hypothetical protein
MAKASSTTAQNSTSRFTSGSDVGKAVSSAKGIKGGTGLYGGTRSYSMADYAQTTLIPVTPSMFVNAEYWQAFNREMFYKAKSRNSPSGYQH